ncbi:MULTISPECIES: FixH family protein [Aeromonas]|uniref:FixH family protein n=1 Tax=Aeromonas TaxID=642 RepID=UPI0005B3ACB4|nr:MULTISPECIES: FixH family protein [Aeromonas]MBL0605772.1 FixH family protein [Aeromonas caviae]MCU9923881.1 FixH family protein [Aeromonas caviae]NKD16162.1 FixH family protein [Aeromonas caviae]TNH76570.1 cytochrome C oxidase Cbb3 [Aeromonas caviae]
MTQPWYRQFWPWFIIALPCAAVVGSIATAIIASKDGVNLVAEDYYKQGKEINQDLSKFDRAEALGIRIALNVSDKELTLTPLAGKIPTGQALHLSLFHPTLAGLDSEHLLTADGKGVYRLMLDKPLTGKWHVRVDAFNHEWRLQETAQLPTQAAIELDPKGR